MSEDVGILLSASPYSFTDEKTGEVREGVSVNYINVADLSPTSENGNHGVKPAKMSLPKEHMKYIKAAPAVYRFYYKAVPGRNAKMELRLAGVEYLGECLPYMLEHISDDDFRDIDRYFTPEVMNRINSVGGSKEKR